MSAAITTPPPARCRSYLRRALQLKPASDNRALISIKAQADDDGVVARNPVAVVKPAGQQASVPRQLSDREEGSPPPARPALRGIAR